MRIVAVRLQQWRRRQLPSPMRVIVVCRILTGVGGFLRIDAGNSVTSRHSCTIAAPGAYGGRPHCRTMAPRTAMEPDAIRAPPPVVRTVSAKLAAVVKGSIATYGTYSVAGKTFTLKIEHSTFPNWIGAEQPRTITVTGDEMKWSNPAGSGSNE
jgi:hypothetical protein